MIFLRKFDSLLLSLGLFFASNAQANSALEAAQKAMNKLRGSPLVVLDVEKTTKSELMGTESTAFGKIFISSDRFRWDTARPEESSIIYDGEIIWTVQVPPKGFKMPLQVTRMKLSPKSEGQIFLRSLFNSDLKNQFKSVKSVKEKKSTRHYLAPTQKNDTTHALEILVGEGNRLEEIAYNDEIENRIRVHIKKIAKQSKIPKELFKFNPPKGAQVNEL